MRPLFYPSIAMKTNSIGSSLKNSRPLNGGFCRHREARVISLRLRSNQNVGGGVRRTAGEGGPHWQASLRVI